MSVRGFTPKQVESLRGAWPDTARIRKGNPSRGFVSQNMRFTNGEALSREGTSAIFTSAGKVSGIYQWLAPYSIYTTTAQNLVMYQDSSAIKRRRLSDSSTLTLLSSLNSMRAPSFADLGPRVYFCGWNTAGDGTIQCRIHDGVITSGTPNVDVAFRGPLTVTAMTATDSGAGQCTKGTHRVAFVYQSRSGFSGQPSPVSSGVFAPASVTLNAGLRTISLSITLDTPSDAGLGSSVYPIMTRADNPDKWFFVPATFFSPDPTTFPISSSGWTQVITISISDEDLANSANPADENFNLLVAGASSGPFNPNWVAAYGKRMMYGAGTDVYGSAIGDPQSITQEFSTLQLPSQRQVAIGFQLGSDFFLTGDKWTGRTRDSGDVPQTWEQPANISNELGAPFANCVGTFGDGQSKRWIATEAGLYLFDGAYPAHPITYYWTNYWKRINWAAAYAIQIDNDATSLRCYVAIPLDAATEPSHMLTIDYTNGDRYDSCDISIDNFPAGFSSIRMIKEFATARSVLWIGPSSAASVVHLDGTTHNDVGAAINPIYETSYLRQGELASNTVRVGNADIWIRGNGALAHTWKGLDGTPTVTPVLMGDGSVVVTSLAAAPGIQYLAKGDLSPVENFSMRFEMNEVDGYFHLSGLKAYMRPSLYNR